MFNSNVVGGDIDAFLLSVGGGGVNSTSQLSKSNSQLKARDVWLYNQLKKSRSSFFDSFKFKVVIGTWNVNSKVPNYNVTGSSLSTQEGTLESTTMMTGDMSSNVSLFSSSSSLNLMDMNNNMINNNNNNNLSSSSVPLSSQNNSTTTCFSSSSSSSSSLVSTGITNKHPLDEWLHLSEQPDIIAIGLQEIDMTAEAMLKKETQSKLEWIHVLESELSCSSHTKTKYVRLSDKQLVGMFCCVFIAEKYLSQVKDVQAVSLALGAMGVMGK